MKKLLLIQLLFTLNCIAQSPAIKVGAERTELYLPLLQDKSVAIIANQTSMIKNTHLADSLLALGVDVKKIFSPEHGFRGEADAGEYVNDYIDKKTGLQVISLYGKGKKPASGDLSGIDVVIFDIQDVGVRFYTYLSTMHYAMEACAESKVQFLVLDRPNPNGFYVAGPVLQKKYRSFVGLHPVPIVYGMTLAEYARMINGQGWLKNSVKCELLHILCEGYSHNDYYELPVKPSPNLPDMTSVYLYPSLALFEGTIVSVGRGTDKPFRIIGHPALQNAKFTFTPRSVQGAKHPPYEGVKCNGYDLSVFGKIIIRSYERIYLYWLTGIYKDTPDKKNFFLKNGFFNLLAGNATLKQQIIEGVSEEDIQKSWEGDIKKFKQLRKGYLLYPDFE